MTANRIVVVGARGAVGRELIGLLAERDLAPGRVIALGRDARDGVETLAEFSFAPSDTVFFCVDAEVSWTHVPRARDAGARVIDLSSAFRSDPWTPLVVPEVNAHALTSATNLVANPNCTSILLCVVVAPLARAFGLERVVVSTYQAVSGAGAAGLSELVDATRAELDGAPHSSTVFPEPIAFNVFSHESPVDDETGRSGEEQKVIDETRRILQLAELGIACTCVRVPVARAHTESVNVQLTQPVDEASFRHALAGAAGITVVDDRAGGKFPTPRRATGRDDVLVGRVRPDPSLPHQTDRGEVRYAGFDLLLSGDQLRKGAARNALQIMDAWEKLESVDESPPAS